MNFEGKKILVTGATGGIGGAIVKKFLSLNASVLGTGTNLEKLNFTLSEKKLVSNVTGKSINEVTEIKNLLIKQIESRVKWKDSIKYMTQNGIRDFIEIGPGKVLSGLVKRIDREVKVSAINNEEDINKLKNTYEF